MLRAGRKWTVCAGIVLSSLAMAADALASPDLLLDGEEQQLAGAHRFRYVRLLNGAKLVVPPYAGDPATGGRLEIVAHWIFIDGTSSIDATGAGYRGQLNANGEGNGGGKGALVSSDATGGGGHGAPGGNGVLLSGCAAIDGATGGVVSVAGPTDVTFGGAGAAAGSADGDDGGRGGNGGGAILLRAGKIELEGQVIVNGEAGAVYQDDSAGGGAGGGILLEASQWLSFGGALVANGASGGLSSKCEGGAGGGGLIRLFVPAIPVDVTISQTGGTASCPAAEGHDTPIEPPQDMGCLDLDGDGFQSDECGGTDCDDSDPNVKQGATEVCNGADDDCDGTVDDGANASCPGGQCVNGACVASDGGTEDAMSDASEDTGADVGQDAVADGPAPEDGGEDAAADAGLDGGVKPDAAPETSGTQVTLRGGCRMGRPIPEGSMAWIFLILAALPFVRTTRRPRK
jgi:Putative metal-binding motif